MSFVPRSLEDLAHEFPPDIQHLSASGINTAMRCLEQWRQVYIKGLRIPPSLARIAGRADHAAIEKSMRQKIETHEDLPVMDVVDTYIAEVENDVVSYGKDEIDRFTTDEYDKVRYEGATLIAKYHGDMSPLVQPIAVEENFSIPVDGLPVVLEGRLDLETDNQVIDRKRTSRRPTKPKPEWVMQGRIYRLVKPKDYVWHLSIHTKTPVVTEMESDESWTTNEATRQTINRVAAMIGSCYMQFGPDEPWPTTGATSDWACSWCSFRPTCPFWVSP